MERKKIINKICKLTWYGEFKKAKKIIDKLADLTPKEATKILENTGIDYRYFFIKDLILKYGGNLSDHAIATIKAFMKNKKNKGWMPIPDVIKAFKFILSHYSKN